MVITRRTIVSTIAALMLSTAAYALTQLESSPAFELSDQTPDFNLAFKPKLVRLSNGWLVSVYGDAVEEDMTHLVYDPKGDVLRQARDIFARRCDSVNTDCSDPANWSPPVNISNTALLSSISTDWDGDLDASNDRKPYYGDSDKPNIFSAGGRVAVSWVDKYCPDGDLSTPAIEPTVQRTVTYLEREFVEVPFSCTYVVASANGGAAWGTPVQMSTGLRDAKQDVHRGLGSGHWALIWQEDPSGLKLGEGEGPGHGASGAKVSHGTDVWYSYADPAWVDADELDGFGFWRPPVRLTDNYTGQPASGNTDTVREADGTIVDEQDIEGGIAGASRANLALVDDSARSGARIAVVAYEETKGAQELDYGKFIRFHSFVWNDIASEDPAGCVISDPTENSRRVRFVPQKGVGPNSALRLGVFWKQGLYAQGGPSDIMLRFGFADLADTAITGLETSQMIPAVDMSCVTSDYATVMTLVNEPAVNLSSETPTATPLNLGDTTSANDYEDARAHRAVLRGDDFYIGWSYTPDWAVARFTDLENYNFWLRHYDGVLDTWTDPVNLSNIEDVGINVKEPRIVGMPGNGPKCADPAAPVDPEDCQSKSTLVIAWGTETNVYEHIGGSVDLEIYYTRTTDKAQTFEPVVVVPDRGGNSRFESQLRPTPAGNFIYSVWGEKDVQTLANNAMFSMGIVAANEPPVASATAVPIVVVGDQVTLNGSGSSDPDDDALSYLWTLGTPAGSTAVLSDETTVSPTFVADLEGSYEATLVVNDGQVDSNPASVTVVAEADDPPTANAGTDRTVDVGTPVTLSGAASTDPENTPLAYRWTLTTPLGSAVVLSNPALVSPSFTPDIPGTYTATLVVNDGTQDSPPDSVTVTAIPLQADLAISLSASSSSMKTRQEFTLDVTVSDAGPGEADNVQIVVSLPANIEMRGSATCQANAGGMSCSMPTMNAGDASTFSATLFAASKGDATITATVGSDMVDPDAANNTAALDVSVLANDSGGSGAIGLLELLAMTCMSLAAIARRVRRS